MSRKKKTVAKVVDTEPEYIDPAEEPMAAIKLELHHPEVCEERATTHRAAWDEMRHAYNDLNQSMHLAMRNVILHVGGFRDAGQKRFMSAEEKKDFSSKGYLPDDCYDPRTVNVQVFQDILGKAIRTSGLSEYIYSSVAKRIAEAEFKGKKLGALLRGENQFPTFANVGLSVRNRNWTLSMKEETKKGDDGVERTYINPVVEITSLRPGGGRFRFVCKGLRNYDAGKKAVLERLDEMGQNTHEPCPACDDRKCRLKAAEKHCDGCAVRCERCNCTGCSGWAKGAMTLRRLKRPGQDERWQILIPYKSPGANLPPGEGVMAINRGVVNAFAAVYVNEKVANFNHRMPGDWLIQSKCQFHGRQKRVLRDITARRGRRNLPPSSFGKLREQGDKERRFMDTAAWEIASFVAKAAVEANARVVIIENFSNFLSDVPGDDGRYLQPYLRRFPFADIKNRIIDRLTRREGVRVRVMPSQFISQKCPNCGHTSRDNIKVLPRMMAPAPKEKWEGPRTPARAASRQPKEGRFQCEKCGYTSESLDTTACLNLMLDSGELTGKMDKMVRDELDKVTRMANKMREQMREHRRRVVG
jgi:hypothetical protein